MIIKLDENLGRPTSRFSSVTVMMRIECLIKVCRALSMPSFGHT